MRATHELRVTEVRALARNHFGLPAAVEVVAQGGGVELTFVDSVDEAPRVGDPLVVAWDRKNQ